MPTAALALYLDSPLQSWGFQSRLMRRTTLGFPTRSGLVGMFCAALGIDRNDDPGLRRLDDLRLTVHVFEPGAPLVDFHTVGGGYPEGEKQRVPNTAEGKPGRTIMTFREYLQGARFGVVVEHDKGESALLDQLADALEDPTWGLWLGRKSCIPASPVLQGRFASGDEALQRLRDVAGREPVKTIVETGSLADAEDVFDDFPLSYGDRRFARRAVIIEVPSPEQQENDS